jgi:hypothetical protein
MTETCSSKCSHTQFDAKIYTILKELEADTKWHNRRYYSVELTDHAVLLH